MDIDLEDMYTILYGASPTPGVNFNTIKKWFLECDIIDGTIITEYKFSQGYERVCPNFEDLTLTKFIQLIGLLSRDSRIHVPQFVDKFNEVRPRILQEIHSIQRIEVDLTE